VSLNEKTRLAEQDTENAKSLARVNERLKRLGKPAVKKVEDAQEALEKLDPLLEQAVQITIDLAAKTK
jgi:carboxyl-terminal processing protease